MNQFQKISVVLLRLALGWLYFYAGITKLLTPNWSAAGYMQNAKTFAALYHWFLQPGILPIINFVNEWGLTLLGISLIFGIFVRLSSMLGIVLMLMYYFVILKFPHPNASSFIVDEHFMYSSILLFFIAIKAGRIWGFDGWCSKLPICSKIPFLRSLLG